jgi:hypothetical protein
MTTNTPLPDQKPSLQPNLNVNFYPGRQGFMAGTRELENTTIPEELDSTGFPSSRSTGDWFQRVLSVVTLGKLSLEHRESGCTGKHRESENWFQLVLSVVTLGNLSLEQRGIGCPGEHHYPCRAGFHRVFRVPPVLVSTGKRLPRCCLVSSRGTRSPEHRGISLPWRTPDSRASTCPRVNRRRCSLVTLRNEIARTAGLWKPLEATILTGGTLGTDHHVLARLAALERLSTRNAGASGSGNLK